MSIKPRSAARPPRSPSAPALSPPLAAPPASSTPRPRPASRLSNLLLTLPRLNNALYADLHVRDAKSRLPWRVALLAVLALLAAAALAHLVLSAVFTAVPRLAAPLTRASLDARYDRIFYNDSDFAYVPDAALFITTTAKVGSTTFWEWAHRGITGAATPHACNHTYIQNFADPCWLGRVLHPFNLSPRDRWHALHSPDVLRVAITRDPFERLVSAWKSKAACDSDDFGTDVHDRDLIVPILLHQARQRRDATCLSLHSFALVLDTVRTMALAGQFNLSHLNKHFRPQECHFDIIHYHLVLDVSQISNRTLLDPIARRLKHGALLADAPKIQHASPQAMQTMSEHTAALLHKFAILTEPFPQRGAGETDSTLPA